MPIVFLTGGTGSFGQGFVKHLLADPEVTMIRVYSRDEHKQCLMREELKNDRISFFIGDVRDSERLCDAMESSDWVVHAAALKQAPIGEIEPQEFIKTNIIGAMNVANASLKLGVKKVLFISTDKAVEPVNLYGATKMCAEKIFIQADACRGTRKTRFACTRYGNVAMTSGSIIPKLLSLKPNQPAVIYDPHATRFWISLEEANKFVLESIKNMRGGETFIPRLKSAKVIDIIRAVRPETKVIILGHRPGDKRHEVLEVNYDTWDRYSSDANDFMTIDEIKEQVFGVALK